MSMGYFGAAPVKAALSIPGHDPVATAARQQMYSSAQKAWCKDAVYRGMYPGLSACNQAVAAGAPMMDLTDAPMTANSEAAYSNTKLYVGLGIAAIVAIGVGAYLISR